jgi:ABC-2 type transport system ATP-binding protein
MTVPTSTNPPLQPDHAVEISHLRKVYGRGGNVPGSDENTVAALKDLSLNVPRGSFFALLGPNGAGKSTLINILSGLVIKTAGQAKVWGHDIDAEMRAARLSLGVVPQELNLDPFFTPREMLEVQAGLFGVPADRRRSDDILAAVGLADKADAYARSLSGGMRRRLLVAKAMVHSPPVLILDEPTAGVDVELRRQLWVTMRELNARGTTILLTTHYLEEAQSLCDKVAIINHGELVACDDTDALLARLDSKEMLITVDRDVDQVPEVLQAFRTEMPSPRQISVSYPPSRAHSGEIIAAIQDAGYVITNLSTKEAVLEDVFLRLTSSGDDDGGAPREAAAQ